MIENGGCFHVWLLTITMSPYHCSSKFIDAIVDAPMPIKAVHLNPCLANANAEMARDDRRWHIDFTPTAR